MQQSLWQLLGRQTRCSRSVVSTPSFDDLNATLIEEIEHFFVSYNEARGKKFAPLGRVGPEGALERVKEGMARAERKRARKKR